MAAPVTFDYIRTETRPAPCKSRPNRKDRFYLVACCECGNERWLRRHDAEKGCRCRRCQQVDAGRLGYQATVARFGADFAIKRVQQYRLTNPSRPEVLVAEWLVALQVTFIREYRHDSDKGRFLIDVVILADDQPVAAIEINGYQHIRPHMQDRDARFAQSWPLPLLIVDGSQPDRDSVTQFVQGLR